MFSRRARIVLLLVIGITGLALFPSPSIPVTAATPTVNLVLGGTGAAPWAIGSLAPGNSGNNTLTLSNTGSQDGVVTIWISNIVNSEGANPESETGNTTEPGELGNYLFLNVSSANLSANFTLPAKIGDFPHSANDTKYIYINPLKANSTLSLQWEWRLPPETGNDVQGDGLSFTINYTLEEFPPLSPPPLPGGGGGGGTSQTIASVSITKTGPPSIVTGFTGNYTLAVTNTGAVTLNDAVVTNYLPDRLNFQSSVPAGAVTGSQITWNLGTLAIKETKEIVVILGGVNAGAAFASATVDTGERVSASTSMNIMVRSASLATASPPAPYLSLPPTPASPQAAPSNNDTVTIVNLPLVIPAPSVKQKGMSVWLIPAILAGIGAAALFYYILIILMRKRRWDWVPYILTARALKIVAQTTEQRTLFTTKHQKRVAELASAIAREMNLSNKLVKGLLTAGIIHNPGSAALPYTVAQTALQYQERLNGSGYPQKLAGDDILLEARILAVADTIETVADTVKRTSLPKLYHLAKGLDKALKEMQQNSDALYDSEVVKAFVKIVDRGEFGFRTSYD